jgi:hypothetical protein
VAGSIPTLPSPVGTLEHVLHGIGSEGDGVRGVKSGVAPALGPAGPRDAHADGAAGADGGVDPEPAAGAGEGLGEQGT